MSMMILIPTGRIDEVYLALICSGLIVVGRALFIPTSSRRTMWLATACGALTFGATVTLAFAFPERLSLPRSAFVVNNLFCSAFPIVVATAGSRVIFGLREKIREARRLGQYVLGEKLGEGGMGIVYMAQHAMLRRPTAIKVLPEKRSSAAAVLSFEREVQFTAQLTGPHVVSIFDYGRSPDGTFYYAMEYVDGLDLEALVRDYGPQPPGRVVRILSQACDALEEAHAHGLIHRDIKPANILLCERLPRVDVVKVVDFGVVHEVRGTAGSTASDAIVGTPAYLSPEAISDPAAVQPASDIYALGAVGYYLLTGKRVFEGRTFDELCTQHLSEAPVPPSQRLGLTLDARCDELLLRCLAKSPGQRPGSATALRRELDALAESLPWHRDDAEAWWLAFRTRHAEKRKALSSVDAEAKTLAVAPPSNALARRSR